MDGTLTADQTRELLHAVSLEAERLMRAAARAYVDEVAKSAGSAIRGFFGKAAKILRSAFLSAALVLSGPGPMAADERLIFAQQVVAQEAYLRNFQSEVRSGAQPPDGTLVARAGQYGRAAWSVGQNTARGVAGVRGGVEERRILGAEDGLNCDECPELAALGWVPFGTLPNLGETPCRMNCRCHFEVKDASGRIRESFRSKSAKPPTHADGGRDQGKSGKKPQGHWVTHEGRHLFVSGPEKEGPHHDEHGDWKGKPDDPDVHSGGKKYSAAGQKRIADRAREIGERNQHDVRVEFSAPRTSKESAKVRDAAAKGRHTVEVTYEPKHTVERSEHSTTHTIEGEAKHRVAPSGDKWVHEHVKLGASEEFKTRERADKSADRAAAADRNGSTKRELHHPASLSAHLEAESPAWSGRNADTRQRYKKTHRIIVEG